MLVSGRAMRGGRRAPGPPPCLSSTDSLDRDFGDGVGPGVGGSQLARAGDPRVMRDGRRGNGPDLGVSVAVRIAGQRRRAEQAARVDEVDALLRVLLTARVVA